MNKMIIFIVLMLSNLHVAWAMDLSSETEASLSSCEMAKLPDAMRIMFNSIGEYLDKEDFDNLCLTCKEAQNLDIASKTGKMTVRYLRPGILAKILRKKHMLTSLAMKNCDNFDIVSRIIQECIHLKKLDIAHSYGGAEIIIKSIEALPKDRMLALEEVNFKLTGATASHVETILRRCPNLKKLNLMWGPEALAGIINVLNERTLSLEELSVWPTNATNDQLNQIQQALPACRIMQ